MLPPDFVTPLNPQKSLYLRAFLTFDTVSIFVTDHLNGSSFCDISAGSNPSVS